MTVETEVRVLSRESAFKDLRERAKDGGNVINHNDRDGTTICGASALLAGLRTSNMLFVYCIEGNQAHIYTGLQTEVDVEQMIVELGGTTSRSPERIRSLLADLAVDGREVQLGDGRSVPAQEAVKMFDEEPGRWRLYTSITRATAES